MKSKHAKRLKYESFLLGHCTFSAYMRKQQRDYQTVLFYKKPQRKSVNLSETVKHSSGRDGRREFVTDSINKRVQETLKPKAQLLSDQ